MKKTALALLVLSICSGVLFGCGSSEDETVAATDAVTYSAEETANEIAAFHSTAMAPVYEDFEKVAAEIDSWNSFDESTDPSAITDSLGENVIPTMEEILRKLDGIETRSPEATELKSLYRTAMESYKRGYTKLYNAFCAIDEEGIYEANAIIEQAASEREAYEARLDELK